MEDSNMLTNKNDFKNLGFTPEDGYTLADLTKRQIIEGVLSTHDELLKVDRRISEAMKHYDGDTYEELGRIRTKDHEIEKFIRALREEMVAGNIKYQESTKYSEITPKRTSLRAAIIRAGKKSGYSVTRILENAEYGGYEIPHRFGWSFDTSLNQIATQEGFQKLLRSNFEINTILKLRVLATAQINHRKHNDSHFKKYQEVKSFQETSHFTISVDIANNEKISEEKLEQIYEAYQQFKVKYKELKALAEMYESKFE